MADVIAPSVQEIIAALSKLPGVSSASDTNFDATPVAKKSERRVWAKVARENLHEVCLYIRDELGFEHASVVTAVDWIDHLNLVYLLDNYNNGVVIELVVEVPDEDLHIQTVSDIWVGANWHERETYELFGVIFDGHPKLERLLTPETYEFFPFRKSYKLRGQE